MQAYTGLVHNINYEKSTKVKLKKRQCSSHNKENKKNYDAVGTTTFFVSKQVVATYSHQSLRTFTWVSLNQN